MVYAVIILLFSVCTQAIAQDTVPLEQFVKLGDEPASVVVEGRTVVQLYGTLLNAKPAQRAKSAEQRIETALDKMSAGNIVTNKTDAGYALMIDDNPAIFITYLDRDPLTNEKIETVVKRTTQELQTVINEYKESRSAPDLIRGIAVSVVATALLFLLLKLTFYSRKKLTLWAVKNLERKLHESHIKQLVAGSKFVPTTVKRAIALLAIVLAAVIGFSYVTVVFNQFPITRPYGLEMIKLVTDSLIMVMKAVVTSIPNIIMVALIFFLARIAVRATSSLLDRVESGAVTVSSLDNEVIAPTRRIAFLVIWVFAFALAYPFIPGSSTDAFKGVSVLVGLMLSLGASSIVAQGAAGLILMYSRKLKTGDWVTIGEHTGKIISVGMGMTRLETQYNEEVLLPNATIISSMVVNHTRRVGSGTMYSTEVTIGYDAPWRLVHQMLMTAASKTPGLSTEIAPVVTQTALNDFFVEYKLTVHILDGDSRRTVTDTLHANIQDLFNENDVQIMSPHYVNDPKERKVVEKKNWDPGLASEKPKNRETENPVIRETENPVIRETENPVIRETEKVEVLTEQQTFMESMPRPDAPLEPKTAPVAKRARKKSFISSRDT